MRLAPAFTTCPVKPAGIFSPLRTMKCPVLKKVYKKE